MGIFPYKNSLYPSIRSVASQILNCGHSFCGECCWQWVINKVGPLRSKHTLPYFCIQKKTACPVCRTSLTANSMTPNISLDRTVDMHVQMLSKYSGAEWQTGGTELVEFRERQK
ncbi:hypothetical protein K438DRAFT_1707207 [Mycena galopus ATCC 62051]|nr:hypothetical protein K438DRAFT_1707207 [Mycena galopus ATCC 62051]